MPRYIATYNRPVVLAVITALWLGGCVQVPELDATLPDHVRDAEYPALIRLESALLKPDHPREQAEDIEASLNARRERLVARARQLNLPVVDAQTRQRMQTGVSE